MPPSGFGYTDMFEQVSNLTNGWQIEDAQNVVAGPSVWRIAEGKLIQDRNIYRDDEEFTFYEGTSLRNRRNAAFSGH